MLKSVFIVAVCTLFTAAAARSARADSLALRIATTAPGGGPVLAAFDKAASEVKDRTAGRVDIKYFAAGEQGDETDFLRKINLGQLDGAVFTSAGLSQIDGSFGLFELPAMFKSSDELDYVADKLWPYFQKKAEAKGFRLAERDEASAEYFLTQGKIEKLSDLKAQKPCQLGDAVVSALFERLALNGVPLTAPEIGSALGSGAINACYGTPLNAVAWQAKFKFLTSMPLHFTIGATVYSAKVSQKLSASDATTVDNMNRASAKKLRKTLNTENDQAKAVLARQGLTIASAPQAMLDDFSHQSEQVWNDLTGKLYSKEELKMVLDARAEYRKKHP